MPQVIGTDPSVLKTATCRNCGSINQYAPNEVRTLRQGRDISQCWSVTKGFHCAKCHNEIVTYAS